MNESSWRAGGTPVGDWQGTGMLLKDLEMSVFLRWSSSWWKYSPISWSACACTCLCRLGGRESHLRSALNSEFVKFDTTDIWGQIVLCGGRCPMYDGTFSRIYPLRCQYLAPASCDNNNKMSPRIVKELLACPTVWELPSSCSLGSKLRSVQSRGRILA